MSRDIKFRAWRGENMHFDVVIYMGEGWIEDHSLSADAIYIKSGVDILMQFTGLTDKNGVDIYDGDIVSFLGEYKNEPNRQVLFDVDFLTYTILSKQEKEWVDGGSNHYKYCRQEGNTDLYFLNDLDSYELEVIGNIYENKDLLQ